MKDDPYKKSANKYDTFVEPFNRALRQIGLKMHPPTEGMKVLDVGCGSGAMLCAFQDMEIKAQGIEFADPALAFCRQRNLDVLKMDLRTADINQISLKIH